MKKISIIATIILMGCGGISDAEFERQVNEAVKNQDLKKIDELMATPQGEAYKKKNQEYEKAHAAEYKKSKDSMDYILNKTQREADSLMKEAERKLKEL